SAQRGYSLAEVLRQVKGDWCTELLMSLLNDNRPMKGYEYTVDERTENRQSIRVCDEAAKTLSERYPELKFRMVGEYADLDKQIAALKEKMTAKKGINR